MSMNDKLSAKDVTPAVKSAVNAYLMARVYAETMRKAVDKIERKILSEREFYNDLAVEKGKAKTRITNPRQLYLCEDDKLMKWYYDEADKRTRAAGLKPADMERDYCPALVAEKTQTETEWLIMDCAAVMLKMDFDGQELNSRLLGLGLDEHQRFIDLVVGLVVNLPGFKNPIKKAA